MSQLGIPHKHYSDDFKMIVVQEALSGTISKHGICRKYSLSDYILLRSWIRIFAPDSLIKEPVMTDKDEQQKEIERLKTLLAQRELELKLEKMRTDFLDKVIDVAKEMFQIPPGTKKSWHQTINREKRAQAM